MHKLLLLFFSLGWVCLAASAQVNTAYNPRAHSHNDYKQPAPFTAAWQQGFGSIEADIYWVDGLLLVAHDQQELAAGKQLDSLYLLPLNEIITWFKGNPYADSSQQLQLLIDIKSDAKTTLAAFVDMLKKYPALTNCKKLRIVISGNRPSPDTYKTYPSYLFFDGEFDKKYSEAAWARIPMISTNFQDWFKWNGIGPISPDEQKTLDSLVSFAHNRQKKMRLWNAPDMLPCWKLLLDADVDYINTDQIEALGDFFKTYKVGGR
ncbi:MAG TPA: alkaline phosphatase [Flavihumibacter sp.]|nr:alkaline phosphatase [Flavihumibacter sp.]